MLFFPFESITIFFLVCTFNVVISCFGMLCLRSNFLEFSGIFVKEMPLLLLVNAEDVFDETVSCPGMVITGSSRCLFVMSSLLSVSTENLFDEAMFL